MSEKAPSNLFILETHPILANVEIEENDQRELVFLYGYIGLVTVDKVRFYQELDLSSYMEIDREEIVFAEAYNPTIRSSPTKLVVFASADLKVFRTSVTTIKAGDLSRAIDIQNEGTPTEAADSIHEQASDSNRRMALGMGVSRIAAPPACPSTCRLPDGSCSCMKKSDDKA